MTAGFCLLTPGACLPSQSRQRIAILESGFGVAGVTWAATVSLMDRMTQPKCPRCLQMVSGEDTVVFDGGQLMHLDCRRPRNLSREERALLFKYCFDHAVVECTRCVQDFRQSELATDLVGSRTHLCPRCRVDLTEQLRKHLYNCLMLPREVRRKGRAARAAVRRLVKESQLSDQADMLMREAEAAIAALRETMRQDSGG